MPYLTVDYLIVYSFLIAILILGFRAGRGIKDMEEYALANRTFGTTALTLTYLAADTGAPYIIYNTASAASEGIIFPIAFSYTLVVSYSIIALVVVPKMVHFRHCMTLGDIMKSLYGTYSGIISGILSFCINICLLGMEFVVLGIVCESILGINGRWAIMIGGLILAAYAAHGGIKAVTVSDVFQFLVFFVIIPSIASFMLFQAGGIEEVFRQVPAAKLQVFGHEKFFSYLPRVFVFALIPGSIASPVMMQRMLMAKHPNQLRDQFLAVGAFSSFFPWVLLCVGLGALVLYPTIEGNQIWEHTIHSLPAWAKGVGMVAMLGAGMSSLDAILHNAGITLVHDVIKPLCNKKNIAIHELFWARWATIGASIMAITLAFMSGNALQLFFSAVAFQVPTMVFPVLAGILGLKVDARSFYTALGATFVAFIATKLYLPEAYKEFDILIQLLANGVTFFGMHCLQNKGFVRLQRTDAGQQESLVQTRKAVLTHLKAWIPTPQKMVRYCEEKAEQYRTPYTLFGIFGCLTFALPYFMAPSTISQHYNLLLWMRLIGGTMCVLLLIKDQWPERFLPAYSFLGHITLLYCIPFIGTVMFLLYQGSIGWVINICLGIMLLMAMVDWLSFLILTAVGIVLGFAFYTQVIASIKLTLDFSTTYWCIYASLFATLITFLFARRKKVETEGRLAWIGDKFYGKLWQDAYRTSAEFAPVFNRYILIFSEKWTKPRDIRGEPANTASPYHDMPEIDIFNSIVPLTLSMAKQGETFVNSLRTSLAYGIHAYELVKLGSLKNCLYTILMDFDYGMHRTPPMQVDLDTEENSYAKLSFEHFKYAIIQLLYFASSHEQLKELQVSLKKEGKIHIKYVGVSFSSELFEHLFDILPQEQYRTLADFDMGLAKLIIEVFGGSIYYYSRAGTADPYTEFIVTLPVSEYNPTDEERKMKITLHPNRKRGNS